MTRPDLQTMRATALAAAKHASRWAYRNNYANAPHTISVREPNDHTLQLTGLRSWNYAKEAGCSTRTALAHLRKLAAAEMIVERRRGSVACDFAPLREDAIAIGREIIAEMQDDGLPFDDDWREARKQS